MLETIYYFFSKLLFFTGAIFTGNSFDKPLKREEEKELILKKNNGDKLAREKLITSNMRLVAHIAKKYSANSSYDDLLSVGSIGLIKAVDTFDENRAVSLATFASRCIENEILMLLRSNKKYNYEVSLFDKIGEDKDGNSLSIIDMLKIDEDCVFDGALNNVRREVFVKEIEKILTKREFIILSLRFGLKNGKSYCQREVASLLKISRSYVSRIEKKAIEKLKVGLKKEQFYC